MNTFCLYFNVIFLSQQLKTLVGQFFLLSIIRQNNKLYVNTEIYVMSEVDQFSGFYQHLGGTPKSLFYLRFSAFFIFDGKRSKNA